jgi:hypothetical protein
MTEPDGDGTAAGGDDTREAAHTEPPRHVPLLVRLGGRWLCRHEYAGVDVPHGHGPDVQLRP